MKLAAPCSLLRRLARFAPAAATLAWAIAAPASAELYRYVDAAGQVHIVSDAAEVPAVYRDQLPDRPVRRSEDAPAAIAIAATPLHQSFAVTPLEAGSPGALSWSLSTDAMPKREIRALVSATWCGVCNAFMDGLEADPGLRANIDAVLFRESELDKMIDRRRRSGQITHAQAEQFKREAKREGQRLVYPSKVAGTGLPLYFIKDDAFEDIVTGYPTLIECDEHSCTKASRRAFVERYAADAAE